MKTRRNLFITIILLIVAVCILAISTSYAIFNINVTKNKIFKVAIGNLELTLDDQNNTFTDGKIVASNMVPARDNVGITSTGYNFTLKNTGSIDASYSIYLDDVVLSTLPTGTDGRLDNSLVRVNLTNTTTSTSKTYTLSQIHNRLLESGTLDSGDSNSYVLRMWLDYTAGNEAQNKYYATKIRVDSVQKVYNQPGLYDANDNLIVKWDTLVNDYGLNYSRNFSEEEFDKINMKALASDSLSYIISNNSIFTGAKKLIVGNITAIGNNAFVGCLNITDIVLPETITSIGEGAFANNINLTNINLPSGITEIKYGTFYYSNIESIVIPYGVTSIGNNAFSENRNLKYVTIPNSVTLIDKAAFMNDISLESIIIPDSVTRLEGHVFENCTSLSSVTLSNNLQSLGEYVFADDTSLTSIVLPRSLQFINYHSFSGCTGLTSVVFENPYNWINIDGNVDSSILANPSQAASLLVSTSDNTTYYK